MPDQKRRNAAFEVFRVAFQRKKIITSAAKGESERQCDESDRGSGTECKRRQRCKCCNGNCLQRRADRARLTALDQLIGDSGKQ